MRNKGFTLIELLIVIAIIGLLSTTVVFAFNSAKMTAWCAKRGIKTGEDERGYDRCSDKYEAWKEDNN
ncbi:MAG: type II secretion system protein [Dehalococcoidia bacterium]